MIFSSFFHQSGIIRAAAKHIGRLKYSHTVYLPLISSSKYKYIYAYNTYNNEKPNIRSFIGLIWRFFKICCIFTPLAITVPFAYFIPSFRPSFWHLLVWTLENCGPAWIKLGQWASTRRHMLPSTLCETLSRLHDQTPCHDLDFTRRAIKDAFKKEIEEIFNDFDPCPIGSGCIAQIYRAKLSTGQDVAIKVLHPNVDSTIDRDIDIMRLCAKTLDLFSFSKYIGFCDVVEEFRSILKNQLDLNVEAANLFRFNENFKNDSVVTFPNPIRPFISQSVLVETHHKGRPLSDYIQTRNPWNNYLATSAIDILFRMILSHNFVHGDLHPGNILVTFDGASGSKPKLVLLDAGIVCELAPKERRNFRDLLFSVLNDDGQSGKLLLMRSKLSNCTGEHEKAFIAGISDLAHSSVSIGIKHVDLPSILFNVLSLACENNVKLEPKFVSLLISLLVVNGVGQSLAPELNLLNIYDVIKRRDLQKIFVGK